MIKEFLELVLSLCILAAVLLVFTFIVGLLDGLVEAVESFL